MKKTASLALALLLGSTLVSAAGHHSKSQKGYARHSSALPRGFEQLNLSEEQKAKIQAIVTADRDRQQTAKRSEPQPNKQQQYDRRLQQERALLGSKQFDEQAARKMIAERRQARLADEAQRTERELQMLRKRHAIFQVLTPEQQKQYQQMRHRKPVRKVSR